MMSTFVATAALHKAACNLLDLHHHAEARVRARDARPLRLRVAVVALLLEIRVRQGRGESIHPAAQDGERFALHLNLLARPLTTITRQVADAQRADVVGVAVYRQRPGLLDADTVARRLVGARAG